jgi:hypothetical protein
VRGRVQGLLTPIGLLLAAAVIGAACSGGGGQASSGGEARAAASGAPPAAPAPAGDQGGAGGLVLGEFSVPIAEARVIKTAALTLRVDEGDFDRRMQDATLVGARHGGFIASSRRSGGELLSGTVVLRIPSDQFEAALNELKALGKVTEEEVGGEDVTSQFVDLEARLRNWEAQEQVLLGLMEKATSVDDSIDVQRSLQDVQLAIEQIRGQLRVLSDQADFSTITLSLREAKPVPTAKPDGNRFVRAWNRAMDGLAAVAAGLVVVAGFVLPIVLFVLVPLGLGWMTYRRMARSRAARAAPGAE